MVGDPSLTPCRRRRRWGDAGTGRRLWLALGASPISRTSDRRRRRPSAAGVTAGGGWISAPAVDRSPRLDGRLALRPLRSRPRIHMEGGGHRLHGHGISPVGSGGPAGD